MMISAPLDSLKILTSIYLNLSYTTDLTTYNRDSILSFLHLICDLSSCPGLISIHFSSTQGPSGYGPPGGVPPPGGFPPPGMAPPQPAQGGAAGYDANDSDGGE